MSTQGLHTNRALSRGVELFVNVSSASEVSFEYTLGCRAGQGTLEFTVDGRVVKLGAQCGAPPEQKNVATATVPKGRHTLRWVYTTLEALQEGAGVSLKSIKLDDDVGGVAAACTPCPPGFYSDKPTARCKACPPGQISDTPEKGGATKCKPCNEGFFNPIAGAPECRMCGEGTTSGKGATQCSCTYTHKTKDGGEVDLSNFNGIMGPIVVPEDKGQAAMGMSFTSGPQALYFSVCAVQVAGGDGSVEKQLNGQATPLGCVGTYACLTPQGDDAMKPTVPPEEYSFPPGGLETANEARNGGSVRGFSELPAFLKNYQAITSYDSSGTRWRVGGGLTMSMKMGAFCVPQTPDMTWELQGARHETYVYIVCDIDSGPGTPRLMSYDEVPENQRSLCSQHIMWMTAYGCPKCSSRSWAELSTPCLKGVKNITYRMSEECYGGVSQPVGKDNVKCVVDWRNMLSTADYVAMGTLAVGAIVCVGILFERYIMYKRLYERYSSLNMDNQEVLMSGDALNLNPRDQVRVHGSL
eukprot:CAMPEP_0206229202 /NCGR_PEP_ID=MMETSP0047_2-20121206/9570_1 /ASSEMBLY_ACC=CAM_ASM_000192 /TAXON_ID=195065 /ORGANISM="Chroomonas mesostigmatica_cf, Strain CCMP1168" /LENGTH=525 /DNA_ID=CAMNT_0053652483 /DNA_START=57 /DNA_END=1633 /DNA_ORIENTATION=+